MNDHHDIASTLSETARRTPFPPEQRRIVLELGFGSEMREAWLRWAGESDFTWSGDQWGVGILERGWEIGVLRRDDFLKIFARGGDIFEFCPVRKNFRRLDEETFRLFYC